MNRESPLEILRRKLEELLKAEAIASDAAQKFQLQEQIQETRERIRELEGDQATPPAEQAPQVVPKGLRAFDEHDADFFLQLLPGPYRPDGLPESLHFWKTRIEQTDPKQTFRVGVMYGPSGCGKSSIIRAGLLPHLADTVTAVRINASPSGTEADLSATLRTGCPFFAPASDLAAVLRQKDKIPAGRKVLIVIDQFEQWLHGRQEVDFVSLAGPLSECDGGRIQALLLIRVDFWMPLRRFMRQLHIPLEEDTNTADVDLFDQSHARRVLTLFGRSYDDPKGLPKTGPLNRQQELFLDQAIQQLGEPDEGGRIKCVRLSLFADMIQDRPWEPGVLKALGGATGVGVSFLEERLSASTAPATNRTHQQAARNVLEALLPSEGTEIKGGMQPRRELLAKSGYQGRPEDFAELLKILDTQLRIITPTTPVQLERVEGETESKSDADDYYQLTHDYLVPSIRQWLTQERRKTRRGRAELVLQERAQRWDSKPENRSLPSSFEFAKIELLTHRHSWTEPQRKMMRRAGRVHGLRWGAGLLLAIAIAFTVQQITDFVRRDRETSRIRGAVAALRTSRDLLVPRDINDLRKGGFGPEMVLAELQARFSDADATETGKLGLAYGLADYGDVQADFLIGQIKRATHGEATNMVTALGHAPEAALERIRSTAQACDKSGDWRYKARLAIVALHLGDQTLASTMCQLNPDPIQRTTFIDESSLWTGDLAKLSEIAAGIGDWQLCSALCLAVGGVSPDRLALTPEALPTWRGVLTEWYRNRPDAGTHSAARWTLTREAWDVVLPELQQCSSEAQRKQWVQDHAWYVNSVDMTMLCTGTSGNGAKTGFRRTTTVTAQHRIHQVPLRAAR